MYNKVVSSYNSRYAGKVPAQQLYDWRAETEFISGSDLQDIFFNVLGISSPSGYKKIQIEDLYNEATYIFGSFLTELNYDYTWPAD